MSDYHGPTNQQRYTELRHSFQLIAFSEMEQTPVKKLAKNLETAMYGLVHMSTAIDGLFEMLSEAGEALAALEARVDKLEGGE